MDKDGQLFWECTMGEKSHMNLLGKIVFFPLAVFMFLGLGLFDLLFSKRFD